MESVLLSTSERANAETAVTCVAVKVGRLFLTSGAALASVFAGVDRQTATNESLADVLRGRQFYAISPGNDGDEETLESRPIYCISVHRSRLIETSLNEDATEVECHDSHDDSKLDAFVLGLILLFGTTADMNADEAIHQIFDRILPVNRKMIGVPVDVVCTPFKNLSLFNTYTRGVISNVFGKQKCMLLTDAKLTAGCEGSPVFSIYGELIGMVMSVVTWSKGEWMGFTIAVHLYPILKRWLNLTVPKIFFDVYDRYSFIGDREVDSYGVVVVGTRHKWGSGIVVDKANGIVVTCSHVVDYSTRRKDVSVTYKRKSSPAVVLYATPRGLPFDCAVLKVDASEFDDKMAEFKRPTNEIATGETVYVIAYPLFSSRKRWLKGASVSHGVVSKVYGRTMILTSCVSNSGASGGALVRLNGELLGMVTNNAVLPDEHLLIPHITAAVPSQIFVHAVKRFCSTKDATELDRLKTTNRTDRDVWNLNRSNTIIKSKL